MTINTTLHGNFRLMAVEEHFDKNKAQYLIDEKGRYYVPVDTLTESPFAIMPVPEVFKGKE